MSLENKIILAIDDASSILTFLRISLEAQGAFFYAAQTAKQALELYNTLNPDLIVLDLGLPDKDGLSILPELKKDKSKKVIVLTARRENHFREKAQKLGADAYLTKPFMMDDLLEVIDEVSEQSAVS